VTPLSLGPFRVESSAGGLKELAAGKPREADDLDARLPAPNSLRRAGDDAKRAVLAGAAVLKAAALRPDARVALYVGQQQGGLDFCARFIEASVREGPRLASPMHFSESVANNTATHLSLTLGFQGSVQTFIGSRVAGIQALMAAREDLADGVADAGLVVVGGTSTTLTRDAYAAVLNPTKRRLRDPVPRYLRGSVAFLVRPSGGDLSLAGAEVRCEGRGRAGPVLAALRKGGRLLVSGHVLAAESVRRAAGSFTPPPYGECFALDPFLQLLLDARSGPGRREVACLSEEGTVGWLAVDVAGTSGPAAG
jgi:hypothetical protein